MTCKTVKTQVELDAALVDEDVTCVHVESERGVWLTLRENKGKTATLSGNATATLYDNATATAAGATAVHLHDDARLTAGAHVAVHLHSAQAQVSGGVVIDLTQLDLDAPQAWCDHHGVEVIDGRAVLYKALGDDLTAGRDWDREVTYTVGTEVAAADWEPTNECGGGLHLSPTPHLATYYRSDATRWMRCTTDLAELRPINYSGDAAKAKARTVRVESEVDVFARELATA